MFNYKQVRNMGIGLSPEEQAKQKAEQQKAEDLRVKQAGTQESAAMRKDMETGKEIGKDFGLDNLGRSTDFEDVRKTRDLLNTRATEGLSQTEENAIQEKGMQQLQGAEQSQRRKLLSGLGQSGVRGGAAGQMQVELAAQAMNNRRALETDLIMQDEATKRAGETAFGNFAVSQAQFDLAQAAKEKEAMLSAAMFSAELGSGARSQMRQDIAAEKVAQSKQRSCFPIGTLVKMEDGSEKPIESIKIGDNTLDGGKVTATHVFLNNECVYLLDGVFITGHHAVKVDGQYYRVKDIEYAQKTNIIPNIVYNISTENHKIRMSSLELSDYSETGLDLNDEESLKVLNG